MNPVIAAFGEPTPISVERSSAGAYSEETGRWVPGVVTTIEMQAVVIPLKASDFRNLPEGMKERGAIYVYTDDEVKAANEADKIDPDVILWNNRRWQVHSVDYLPHIKELTHYMSVAVKEDRK